MKVEMHLLIASIMRSFYACCARNSLLLRGFAKATSRAGAASARFLIQVGGTATGYSAVQENQPMSLPTVTVIASSSLLKLPLMRYRYA